MWLINICMAIIIGLVCFIFGFMRGDSFATNYFNWGKGWDDCRNAIKDGLSEEGKTLVDLYTGEDEGNEDC